MKTYKINFDYIFVVVFTCLFGYDIWRVCHDLQLTNYDALAYGFIAWGYIVIDAIESYVESKKEKENDVPTDTEESGS